MAGQPKQFGLIMPKKSQLSAPKAVNVFGDDSDLDEDDGIDWVQKSLKAEGEKNRIKKQARINAERALAEDPTIYQYDEIYSEIHVDTKKIKEEKKKQEPKYIGKLLENAEKRKRENEVRIERMVQKERDAEGDMFKDKEKFVTASYRKKLEENKKLEEEEKEKERLEAIGDVTKQVNIDGFYRHFFNQTFEIGPKKHTEIKKEIEINKDETKIEKAKSNKNLDADDSSVNDSTSDDENKKEALKIVSKNRKGKQYRKRTAEASESESEEEKNKENEKAEDSKKPRLETEIEKDKNTEQSSTPEIKQKKKEDKKHETEDKEDPKKETKQPKKDEENPKPKKAERKTSIWVKRTVGPVFEAALQRYYARQAMRDSGS